MNPREHIKQKKRRQLLAELEQIVGSKCYNGNIQNWGPNGIRYGDGRGFRYPLTMVDHEGNKTKTWSTASPSVKPDVFETGYYAFGANRLSIIRALDEVVSYLEANHNLKL